MTKGKSWGRRWFKIHQSGKDYKVISKALICQKISQLPIISKFRPLCSESSWKRPTSYIPPKAQQHLRLTKVSAHCVNKSWPAGNLFMALKSAMLTGCLSPCRTAITYTWENKWQCHASVPCSGVYKHSDSYIDIYDCHLAKLHYIQIYIKHQMAQKIRQSMTYLAFSNIMTFMEVTKDSCFCCCSKKFLLVMAPIKQGLDKRW